MTPSPPALLLALLLALCLPLSAQEQSPQPNRDQLMENLMTAESDKALGRALVAAKEGGLPAQMFLEARFIHLVNQNNLPALAALAPELEKQLPSFSPDKTLIFAVKEDFASIVHYTRALEALQKDDETLFKKHITEAFWLGPDHASQFAPHIKALRLKKAMVNLTLDLDQTFEKQGEPGQTISLAQLKGEAPALLIHFWSPWGQQSLLAMPEIDRLSKTLRPHDLPMVSLLLGGNPEARQDADDFLKSEEAKPLTPWLLDRSPNSLAALLRVSSFPTVVLVDQTGRILFHGDPADPDLWQQLATFDPAIKQPQADLVLPDPGSAPLPGTEEASDKDPE